MLPQTKNVDGRIVYPNTLAQEALAAVLVGKAKPTDLVFNGDPVTPENVSLGFLRACRSVNVSNFPLSRFAAYGRRLDADEGGGHSHHRAHSGP